jgi:5S rRNA maturation endonuclease (ribonuclease M5)
VNGITTDPVADLLSRLENVKPAGTNKWMGKCPSHEDGKASLSVAQGRDGRVLVKCFAGCPVERIVAAVGMKLGDLFADRTSGNGRQIVEVYDYTDDDGDLLYQVVRFFPKDFRQRRPDGKGGWIWNMEGARRVLYRLPALLKADPLERIFIVEGEKDADTLAKLGLAATTNVGGAGKWRVEHSDVLKGRDVVVIPDADDPGRRHGEQVARSLHGKAAAVRVVELPVQVDGRKVKDASDYIAAGGTIEQLTALVEATPIWTPTAATVEAGDKIVLPRAEAYAPFPVDVLPAAVGDYIRAGAAALGCDPAFIAQPLLAALASAIGNTRRIQLKRTWREPSVLWTGTVAPSGTLKSPAQELALGPVNRRLRDLLRAHQAERARYDADVEAWAQMSRDERGEKPAMPAPMEHPLVNDITVEALVDRLSATPRGALVAVDELSGWFGSFGRYKEQGRGADVAHYLSMHRAGAVKIDRKLGDRPTIYIAHAAVSITGGIQPTILRRLLTREFFDNGLAARLLLAMPPVKTKRWTDAEIPVEVEERLQRVFDALWELRPAQDGNGEPYPADVSLMDAGKAAWVAFFNAHSQQEAALAGADLGATYSKLCGGAARLALIVHQVRFADGDKSVDPWHADDRSIASGVTLAQWYCREAERVYGVLGEADEERGQRELVELIRGMGGMVTVRELRHKRRRYRDDAAQVQADLDGLVEGGIGRWETPKPSDQGGHPSRRFVLGVNGVNDNETPDSDSASGSNVDVDGVDGGNAMENREEVTI